MATTLTTNLLDVEHALAKFDAGTYGVCESCHGEIAAGTPRGHARRPLLHLLRRQAALTASSPLAAERGPTVAQGLRLTASSQAKARDCA